MSAPVSSAGAASASVSPADLDAALRRHWNFGAASLKPAQAQAIDALLARRDSLVVLATGYGKSLIFQAPAAARAAGVTVVLSPLLSLAEDQINDLDERGVAVAVVNSSIDAEKRASLLKDLEEDDESDVRLLYVTPESLDTPVVAAALKSLHARGLLHAIAVDEAHCVSTWGHDFRKAYARIGEARDALGAPRVPIQALTATATARVRNDIASGLGLAKGHEVVVGSVDRPSIFLSVVRGESVGDDDAELRDLCEWVGAAEGAGIVYCRTRKETERVAGALDDAGVDAVAYHGGLDSERRKRLQAEFCEGRGARRTRAHSARSPVAFAAPRPRRPARGARTLV